MGKARTFYRPGPQKAEMEVLDKDNYASWSLHMEVALDYGNLWEVTNDPPMLLSDYHSAVQAGAGDQFMQGLAPAPDAVEADTAESAEQTSAGSVLPDIRRDSALPTAPLQLLHLLIRRDKEARSLIAMNCSTFFMRKVRDSSSAHAAWKLLESLHRQDSNSKRLSLHAQLSALQQRGNEDVRDYFERAELLVEELERIGCPAQELVVISALLRGLQSRFGTQISILQARDTPLTISSCLDYLITEQARMEMDMPDNHALHVGQHKANGHQHGGKGGQQGKKPGKRFEGNCNHCGIKGHRLADCRKRLAGEPPAAQKSNPAGSGANTGGIALMATHPGAKPQAWVLDSGATTHMTRDSSLLYGFIPSPSTVHVGNGDTVVVTGTGSVAFKATSGKFITLSNVLLVPELSTNLFSVKQAVAAGAVVNFTSSGALVKVHGQAAVQAIAEQDGLYHVQWEPLPPRGREQAMLMGSAELWHRRLGHPGPTVIKKVTFKDVVTGVEVAPGSRLPDVCGPCAVGKLTRAPIRAVGDTIVSRVLERVHMDIKGPFEVRSLGRARYMPQWLDEASALSIVRPTATKGDVPGLVRTVLMQLETLAEAKVLHVRSDRGGEYIKQELRTWLEERGIIWEVSPPDSPELNGNAERLNRTIIEKALAMMAEADAPKQLWAEAVSTANYLRNRTPGVDGVTPFQKFFDKVPDLSHLRTWGCLTWWQPPRGRTGSLNPKGYPAALCGYAPHIGTYRLLTAQGKIVETRNVRFDEGRQGFPFVLSGGRPISRMIGPADEEEDVALRDMDFIPLLTSEQAPLATPSPALALPAPNAYWRRQWEQWEFQMPQSCPWMNLKRHLASSLTRMLLQTCKLHRNCRNSSNMSSAIQLGSTRSRIATKL
jgi:gag-polypeptide of LTR copia-type/Integrase core domain/GAG-pre-integrase domain